MPERGASEQEQEQEREREREREAGRVYLGWVEGEEVVGDEQAAFSDHLAI